MKGQDREIIESYITTEMISDPEKVVQGLKARISQDFKINEKIQLIKHKIAAKNLKEIVAIETQKFSDSLLVNLGFDLDEMLRAARHYNINTSKPDMKQFLQNTAIDSS